MLVSCIYFIIFIFFFFSIVLLMYSKKNNNKYLCNKIIMVSIICILYLVVDINMTVILKLYVPSLHFSSIFTDLFAYAAVVIYIICIDLNVKKRKTLEKYVKRVSPISIIIILCILSFPIFILSKNILNQKNLIDNSELVVVFKEDTSALFDDEAIFAYAINENNCKSFELGIDINGHYLKQFLPKKSVEISDINNLLDYKISLDSEHIFVYKNNKKICSLEEPERFNIEFKKGFYIRH